MGRNDTALVIGALVCCIIVLGFVYYSTRQVDPPSMDTGPDWSYVYFNTTGDGRYLNLTVNKTENLNTDLDNIVLHIRFGGNDIDEGAPLSEFSHPNVTFIDSDNDGTLSKGDVISIDGSFSDAGYFFRLIDKEKGLQIIM